MSPINEKKRILSLRGSKNFWDARRQLSMFQEYHISFCVRLSTSNFGYLLTWFFDCIEQNVKIWSHGMQEKTASWFGRTVSKKKKRITSYLLLIIIRDPTVICSATDVPALPFFFLKLQFLVVLCWYSLSASSRVLTSESCTVSVIKHLYIISHHSGVVNEEEMKKIAR